VIARPENTKLGEQKMIVYNISESEEIRDDSGTVYLNPLSLEIYDVNNSAFCSGLDEGDIPILYLNRPFLDCDVEKAIKAHESRLFSLVKLYDAAEKSGSIAEEKQIRAEIERNARSLADELDDHLNANFRPMICASDYLLYEFSEIGGLSSWWKSKCMEYGLDPEEEQSAIDLSDKLESKWLEPLVYDVFEACREAQRAYLLDL
jgi:hypothetical protein